MQKIKYPPSVWHVDGLRRVVEGPHEGDLGRVGADLARDLGVLVAPHAVLPALGRPRAHGGVWGRCYIM